MTNPSPPSSPFEQVVEAMFDALPSFNKQMSYDEARPDLERAARNLDRHGLLKLVEEQPSSKPAPRTSKDLDQPRGEPSRPSEEAIRVALNASGVSHTGEADIPAALDAAYAIDNPQDHG